MKKIEKLLNSKTGKGFLRKLENAAHRVLGDKHLAEDVVQDAFEYFADRDVPVKKDAEVEPYLITTVTNRAVKMKKKLAKTTLLGVEELEYFVADDPAESEEKEWQYATMLKCIKRLDVKSRRVLTLRYLRGNGTKTVERMMKMDENEVNRTIKRAIDELTKMVKDERKNKEW